MCDRNAVQPSAVARVGLEKDPVTLWRWLDGSPVDFLYWQDPEKAVSGVRQCATVGTYALIMDDCTSPSSFFCQADLGKNNYHMLFSLPAKLRNLNTRLAG